jgi:isoleucyl-tRNA synthetase
MKGENLMYNKVDSSKGTVNMEQDIAKLWTEKDIIKKSFDSNQDGEYFTFYT